MFAYHLRATYATKVTTGNAENVAILLHSCGSGFLL